MNVSYHRLYECLIPLWKNKRMYLSFGISLQYPPPIQMSEQRIYSKLEIIATDDEKVK